jgi:RNA ligase
MEFSTRIEDYIDAIEGCDSFIVAEREYGRIINYVIAGSETFPDPSLAPDEQTARKWMLRRQCRGLLFNLDGSINSLPYHKFFNVGERAETLIDKIDITQPHVILEKLDGSMVRPIRIDDAFRMGTKMGLTDVSLQSEVFVAEHTNYIDFIKYIMSINATPIFEWCSRKQRIVIDYPKDRLILTAVRNNQTGVYLPLLTMQKIANDYNIEVVRQYEGTIENMQSLLDETAGLQGQEGWVIRFAEEMYKIKAEEYVLVHKAKADILREKGVIEMLLNEKVDDFISLLLEEDRNRLEEYETAFWNGIHSMSAEWETTNNRVRAIYGNDRKTFAIDSAPKLDHHVRGAIFKSWDSQNFNWRESIINTIRKNIGTQTKINDIRYLWGNTEWKYAETEE